MNLAKLSFVKSSRKEFTCSKCREVIPKGSSTVRFTVGFRSRYVQTRHNKPECMPTRAERESSAVATIYDVQDRVDVSSASSQEELEAIRDEVASACEEVASEYEDNEMYEKNYDLQERAEQIRSAGQELEGWEPEDTEPTEDNWSPEDDDHDTWEDAHEAWLEEARSSLEAAIDEMDLP